jgi:hypothetical protein
MADFTLVYILKNFIFLKTLYIVIISRIKCEFFAAQLSRGGDQRCRIRNRIRIRSRILNKSFRIHNLGLLAQGKT